MSKNQMTAVHHLDVSGDAELLRHFLRGDRPPGKPTLKRSSFWQRRHTQCTFRFLCKCAVRYPVSIKLSIHFSYMR